MKYEEKNISKPQQKLADKFIDSILGGAQLEHPPSYKIMGANPNEDIAQLEFQKFEKNEKEIKKIDRQIKILQSNARYRVKVVFEFKENPKKLVCTNDSAFLTRTFWIPRYTWSGVLDFSITGPFLFGRVAKTEKFGGGKFCFAPFNNHKIEFTNFLEQLEEKAPELFPYDVIESYIFIKFIEVFKMSYKAKNLLEKMRGIIESDYWQVREKYLRRAKTIELPSEQTLVEKLNLQNDLRKSLKKIPHLGHVVHMNIRIKSKIDVSTLFIPYKDFTYFHIEHYEWSPKKKHFRVIKNLIQLLETFS